MPNVTQLPNGMYRITEDTGVSYDVPAEIAAADYGDELGLPELPGADMAKYSIEQSLAEGYGMPEPQFPVQDDLAAVQGIAEDLPDVAPPEEEMVFEEDVLPTQRALAQQPQSRSQAVSVSERGTGPFQFDRSQGFTRPPDYTPELLGMADSARSQQEALGLQREAAEGYRDRAEGIYGDMAQERQYQAVRAQEMHDNAMQAVMEQEERLAQRMQNMTRMDMNKIWKETPQGAKMAGLFSAAIAGWLNPTGKNSVVEQMMQMVDQSAREQAANMELERFQIQGEQAALGRFENRAARDRQVFLENRALILAGLQDSLAMERDKFQSEITIAKVDQQIAAVQQEFAKTAQAMKQQAFQNSFARDQAIEQKRQADNALRQRAAQFSRSMKLREAEAMAKARGAGAMGAGKGLFALPDQRVVYANPDLDPNDTRINKIDSAVAANRAIADTAKRLYALAMKGRRLSPDAREQVKTEIATAIEDLRPILGANLPEGEADRAIASFGNPNKILTSPDAVMKAINRGVRARRARVDRILGQIGARVPVGVDANGQPVFQMYRERTGMIDQYFPGEFGDITMEKAVETDISDRLDEAEANRERYETLRNSGAEEAVLGDAKASYDRSVGEVMELSKKYGISQRDTPGLYGRVAKIAEGAGTDAALAYAEREPFEAMGKLDRLQEGPMAFIEGVGSDIESGEELIEMFNKEVAVAGHPIEVVRRAERGEGSLTPEEARKAYNMIMFNLDK